MSDDDRKKQKGKAGKSLKDAMGLYGYMDRYKHIFIPSLFALYTTAALSLAFPYFLSKLIGKSMMAGGASSDAAASKAEIIANVNVIVLWLIGALLLQSFITYWRVRGFINSGEGALNEIRRSLFSRMVRLPMNYLTEKRSGELSSRIAGDLSIMRETLITTVPKFGRMIVTLIGGLIVIFMCSWKLSLIMLGSVPIVVLAIAVFGKKIKNYSKATQDALADTNIVVEETIMGIYDTKAFCNEEYEENRYDSALTKFLNITVDGAKARAAFISFIILVLFSTVAFIVWYGAQMLANGEINIEDYVRFILFSVFVAASLGSVPEIMSQLQITSGATERIRDLIDEEMEENYESQSDAALVGSITAENLSFAYPSRPEGQVLNGVDFEVKTGERVALVGPSGGGKSTVFALLLGFYQGHEGELKFDGKPISEIGLKNLRSSIAVVPQEVLLFGGSIEENIAYGKPGSSKEEIIEAAKQANAHEFITEFETGYETTVGPRGIKLSGGQRQRVAIARAILADPKILLLDEATSALDSENERLVQAALDTLMKGRTSMIIAHRLSTVRDADRILVLQHGKIVESGSHDELMSNNGTYKLLAETQLGS
ncbi:MAG: ATP-binding cassette subfamily B protein [Cryomorphaceae bacterium]|jgi:ATP-binding cassette subfamily B protein